MEIITMVVIAVDWLLRAKAHITLKLSFVVIVSIIMVNRLYIDP